MEYRISTHIAECDIIFMVYDRVFLISLSELEIKLDSAEDRCKILEKQLEYMKKLAQTTTEQDRPIYVPQSTYPTYQPASVQAAPVQSVTESPVNFRELTTQAEKLAELQRGHIQLTASQTLAEV